MAIFPGEPGLAGFIGAKDDRSGGDNWSHKTCKAPVKSSPPTNQHPVFLQAICLPCHQTEQKGKTKFSTFNLLIILMQNNVFVTVRCYSR